ncbi:MAG: prepilin peptidase [Candidatus Dojkabacteria bacterium]|nr:MAG: prepilin peptidase [Candidatus Dojkabacteria bacterium]
MDIIQLELGVYLFLVGLLISEFIQVLVDRDNNSSSIFDRSRCDHCKKPVPWYGMVPLFGYFLVKGKCIHCGKKISLNYPLFEWSFAIMWAATLILIPHTIISALIFLSILCVVWYLAYYDLKQFEVPVIALVVFGILLGIFHLFVMPLRLDVVSVLLMALIIVVAIVAVMFQKQDAAFSELFGLADWIVILATALLFGIEATVIVICISVGIFVLYLLLSFGLKLKQMKGVPFLFWYLPIWYWYLLYLTTTVIVR